MSYCGWGHSKCRKNVLKYIVKSHYRFRSCDSLKYLLKSIFPDSAVTEKISMGKDKARYLIIYVIFSGIQTENEKYD